MHCFHSAGKFAENAGRICPISCWCFSPHGPCGFCSQSLCTSLCSLFLFFSSRLCFATQVLYFSKYIYIYKFVIFHPLANLPYRIGTPRCCIKRFFIQVPPQFQLPCLPCFGGLDFFLSQTSGSQFWFFWVPKFSDFRLQFYMRLQFYSDICRFCVVLFSCQYYSVSMYGFMKQLGHQRVPIL